MLEGPDQDQEDDTDEGAGPNSPGPGLPRNFLSSSVILTASPDIC